MARRSSPLRRFLTGPRPRALLRQVYADSYTLSGCREAQYCGVFRRVAAHCAGGDNCPGGASARPGWSDATLCDGAPVYQLAGGGAAGGAVLFRFMFSGGRTQWFVGPSSHLGDCAGGNNYYVSDRLSAIWPPDAAGYGWSDPGGYGSVHIVVGDGGGGGGR